MFGPVWISPLEKSILVPKIWISTSEKSIHAEIYAHIWVCPFWNPNMCIYKFIYGFLQQRNPYFWHLLGFTQWANLNWHRKYRFLNFGNPYVHAYMHIFGVSKYVKFNVCKQIWISLRGKPKFLTPVWIYPLEKFKLVLNILIYPMHKFVFWVTDFSNGEIQTGPKIWIYPLEEPIYICIYAHIWVIQMCACVQTEMDFANIEIKVFETSPDFSIGEIQTCSGFSIGEI